MDTNSVPVSVTQEAQDKRLGVMTTINVHDLNSKNVNDSKSKQASVDNGSDSKVGKVPVIEEACLPVSSVLPVSSDLAVSSGLAVSSELPVTSDLADVDKLKSASELKIEKNEIEMKDPDVDMQEGSSIRFGNGEEENVAVEVNDNEELDIKIDDKKSHATVEDSKELPMEIDDDKELDINVSNNVCNNKLSTEVKDEDDDGDEKELKIILDDDKTPKQSESENSIVDSPLTASNVATPVKTSGDHPSTLIKLLPGVNTPLVSTGKNSPIIRKPRGKSHITDMSPEMLELFRQPFKHGWKREVVNRNVTDSGKRGQCDIYYFAPTGKKLRSMVEIDDWLKKNSNGPIQYKHFSFAKMPLSEPPLETVRDAGKPRKIGASSSPVKTVSKTVSSLNITPRLPVRGRPAGLKLSSVLPRQSELSKRSPKLIVQDESKGTSSIVQRKMSVVGQHHLLKGPYVKRTKMVGHSFLKKRRLSPDWHPSYEEGSKASPQSSYEVITPRISSNIQSTEHDDLQSMLGTPSKLISSIVNPEPPKELPKMASLLNAPSISGPNVPPNVQVRIVSKNDHTILTQLGLMPRNVRMVNIAPKGSQVSLLNNASKQKIVYLPAGQRPFTPFIPSKTISTLRHQTVKSAQSFSPFSVSQAPTLISPLRQAIPISTMSTMLPTSSTALSSIIIPPPPPLALRPDFEVLPKMSCVSIPPMLQNFSSTPMNILRQPPLLQAPATVTYSLAPSSATPNSTILQHLASKTLTDHPTSSPLSTDQSSIAASSQPAHSSTMSIPKSVMPTLLAALSRQDTYNHSVSRELPRAVDDMLEIPAENSDKRNEIPPDCVSDLNEDDQDFALPVNFGIPPLSECVTNITDPLFKPDSIQKVNVSIHVSQLDICCPVRPKPVPDSEPPSPSITHALEDCDNVFITLPASYFKNVNAEKPVSLNLNGHDLSFHPRFTIENGNTVKLKTTVKNLKEWVAKQFLKYKVLTGQKRRIVLSGCRSRADYMRSFILLEENYNIMMSIFRNLSTHELLRACRVCKIWRRMALQKCLWRKIDLRGFSQIKWIPAVNFFLNVDVRSLIMPEPLLAARDRPVVLDTIVDAVSRLTQLKEICFGTVSQTLIETFLQKMPCLKSVGAESIVDCEENISSNMPATSSATAELAMMNAVELVLSGCFSVTESASMAGVPEGDLFHLTQRNRISLNKQEEESTLLCCMRLSKMGFTIDYTVVEARFQEAVNRRTSSVKLSTNTQRLICQKMYWKNHHLFQLKSLYQPHDSMTIKLKAYSSNLRTLYREIDLKSGISVMAFVIKEFQVLNVAGNKMIRIFALSVINPAHLHLPVMLVFPVAVSYIKPIPGLILITSKEGMLTANLVTHYLRAVFDNVQARPLIIFFDGHENLLSQELVSDCVGKSVVFHCVPKELSPIVFPGNHGGLLHTVSKKIGKQWMVQHKFISLITCHLREELPGMAKAFKITGTFPHDPSASTDLYYNSLISSSDVDESESNLNNEYYDDEDNLLSSDKEEKDSSTERWQTPQSQDITGKKEKCFSLYKEKSLEADAATTSCPNGGGEDVSTILSSAKTAKRKREDTTYSSTSDNDVVEMGWSKETDSSEDENDVLSNNSSKLVINIDDEKENLNRSKSPLRKKLKADVSEPENKQTSIDYVSQTIDTVIAQSKSYFDNHEDSIIPSPHPSVTEIGNGNIDASIQPKPSLKIKLVSIGGKKEVVHVVNNDVELNEDSALLENRESNGSSEDEVNLTEVSEEEADGDEDDGGVKTTENKIKETVAIEGAVSEGESDSEMKDQPSAEESADMDKEETHLDDNRKRQKKKRKKERKKRRKEKKSNGDKDASPSDSPSKKKKKKRKKSKKEDTVGDSQVCTEKDSSETVDATTVEVLSEDPENTMMLMRRISLADHDYEAKFDSDSGNELIEENASKTKESATVTDETATVVADETTEMRSKEVDSGQESDKLPVLEDGKDDGSGTSESSSDSDSSEQSESSSSSSNENSSSDSEGSTSAEEEEEASDNATDNATAVNHDLRVAVVEESPSKEKEDSSDDSESGDDKEAGDSSNDEEVESDENGDDKNQSEGDEDEENQSGDDGDANVMYSDDDDEDESGGDDDAKCQLCMATNPPHSKDQIIDWVDCDRNCNRWFHVICIQRSQSKGNPKRFVCPSCRCKR